MKLLPANKNYKKDRKSIIKIKTRNYDIENKNMSDTGQILLALIFL